METIRVNMTPCEDIKTIHASQNDNEAREWGFELHNNGEKIDSSSISDQMVFKAYKGGTEEILPTNGSTPTTSPFLGDIKYPQGLLSDQEFLYRESPTEEDGNAKIKSLYGNTLVWNQLVQNGNFADTSNWQTEYNATVSVSNNVLSITPTEQNGRVAQKFTYTANHKLLIMADVKLSSTSGEINRISLGAYAIDDTAQSSTRNPKQSNDWQKLYVFCYSASTHVNNRFLFTDGRTSDWGTTQIRNFMAFDLTSMFGETKANELFASEQSQVGKGLLEFTSLFPLPYYAYNQGTLLSFNGNGIKTVWFNQWDEEWELGSISNVGENISSTTEIRAKNYIRVMPNQEYYLHASVASTFNYRFYDADKRFISAGYIGRNNTLLTPNGVSYMRFYMGSAYGTTYKNDICINISDTERNGQYEPYTSSTLSLPISTYFPNGMDGVGTAYDELTSSKATMRIDRIDLGSITYTRVESQTSGVYFFVGAFRSIPNIKDRPNSVVWNIKTPLYETVPSSEIYYGRAQNKTIGGYDAQTVRIRDDSFTDATAFKNSLSGQYLVYELATPTETTFTTASLVTENGEIPLSNEDGVLVGKCTEQLSSESGFFDAKIKLTDSDGECYSNKIQLHIERSPQ